jgi:hypothetical protein
MSNVSDSSNDGIERKWIESEYEWMKSYIKKDEKDEKDQSSWEREQEIIEAIDEMSEAWEQEIIEAFDEMSEEWEQALCDQEPEPSKPSVNEQKES